MYSLYYILYYRKCFVFLHFKGFERPCKKEKSNLDNYIYLNIWPMIVVL